MSGDVVGGIPPDPVYARRRRLGAYAVAVLWTVLLFVSLAVVNVTGFLPAIAGILVFSLLTGASWFTVVRGEVRRRRTLALGPETW